VIICCGVFGSVQLEEEDGGGRREKGRVSLAHAGLKKVLSFILRVLRIGFLERIDLHSETKG